MTDGLGVEECSLLHGRRACSWRQRFFQITGTFYTRRHILVYGDLHWLIWPRKSNSCTLLPGTGKSCFTKCPLLLKRRCYEPRQKPYGFVTRRTVKCSPAETWCRRQDSLVRPFKDWCQLPLCEMYSTTPIQVLVSVSCRCVTDSTTTIQMLVSVSCRCATYSTTTIQMLVSVSYRCATDSTTTIQMLVSVSCRCATYSTTTIQMLVSFSYRCATDSTTTIQMLVVVSCRCATDSTTTIQMLESVTCAVRRTARHHSSVSVS